ncbi:hypothetical protein J6590_000176 [Homalodisca vitripennis]|nr:hypothetical protein J6590_000176 [Homalodisca vitripennis]
MSVTNTITYPYECFLFRVGGTVWLFNNIFSASHGIFRIVKNSSTGARRDPRLTEIPAPAGLPVTDFHKDPNPNLIKQLEIEFCVGKKRLAFEGGRNLNKGAKKGGREGPAPARESRYVDSPRKSEPRLSTYGLRYRCLERSQLTAPPSTKVTEGNALPHDTSLVLVGLSSTPVESPGYRSVSQ